MEDIRGDCQCGHKVTAHNTQGCHALGCACTAIYDYTNDMAPWESDEAGTGALQLVIAWLEQNGHGKDDEHSRKLHKGCYACRILIECRKELNEIAALRTQLGKANIALEVFVSSGIHDVRMRWANGAVCEDCSHELCNMVRNLRAEVMRLTGELETERLRLAGCGVAAMQNTVASREDRILPESPYWSASYGDVCGAVDREMNLRDEVERLKTEQGEALADQRRALCAEHDKDLMELKRVRKVAAEEVARLTGELAEVRRERESQSKCKHPYCRAACQDGEHFIKCQDCGLEWVQPCDHHMHIDLASALARNAALEEAGDAMANSADCVGLHNRNEVKHWRQVRGERP